MNELRPEHHAVQLREDVNKDQFARNNETISSMRLVVHTTGRWANSNMSNNHVTILLLLSGSRSVQLNMATDDNDTRGVFIWALRAWQESNSAITSLNVAMKTQTTVGMVYRFLREAGIHRYQFSGGGSGCRFWVISVVRYLSHKGVVASESTKDAEKFLKYQYSRTPGAQRREIEIKIGEFLTEECWLEVWSGKDSDDDGDDDDDDDEDESIPGAQSSQTPAMTIPGFWAFSTGMRQFSYRTRSNQGVPQEQWPPRTGKHQVMIAETGKMVIFDFDANRWVV